MGKQRVVYQWTCCYCGHGVMNVASTPACFSCGVARCGNCRTEAYEVDRGRGRPARLLPTTTSKERTDIPAAAGVRTANTRQSSSRTSTTPPKAAKSRNSIKRTAGVGARKGESEAGVETPANAGPSAKEVSESPGQKSLQQSRDLMRDLLDVKEEKAYQEETPGIANADVSDSQTVVSTLSSVTTLVDPGAVEEFAESVIKFQSLRYLWPQLVERCDSKQIFIQATEVLLKRYAKDLVLVEDEVSVSDKSRNQRRLAAARFIRGSRIQIANKVWEAQAEELMKPGGRGPLGQFLDTEIFTFELDEDEFVLEDDDLKFETIEEILFDKGPVFSLQANIKLLISLWNPMETSKIFRLSSSINTSLKNAISSLREPPVPPGNIRLRYRCRCGRELYDDFEGAQSGALSNLENLLTSYFGGHPVTLEPGDFERPKTPGNSRGINNTGTQMNLWKYFLNRRQQDPSLPRTRQDSGETELHTCSSATANRQANHTRVLLCLPFMQWAKKLHQIDTCNLRSDQAFFLSLRQQYSVACQSRRWSSITRPRRVTSLEFVKFEVYKNELIDVHDSPSVPDRDDKDQAKRNYIYNPLPAELNPPIGTNLLMHLYQNPTHADVEPIMYRKIPKKLRDKLQACPAKGSAVGWGVHFTEGVDWLVLFSYGCVGFFFALVFAVAWSVARGDIQSGFAMGSFMVAFVIFCLGIAQTEVQLGI